MQPLHCSLAPAQSNSPTLLLQCGVTPVSQINLEKLVVVQTSVYWATATRAGRVAVGLALAWETMANRARVSDIIKDSTLTIDSPEYFDLFLSTLEFYSNES